MKFSLALEVMSVLQIISYVKSFPVNKKSSRLPVIPTNEQMKFMQRFGYLEGDQPGFEAQYTESSIADAIISIQKYGGVNTTGVFDESTVKLMRKRRCGVKDVIRNKRKRRFAIAGGWRKRELTYFLSNWTPKIGEEGVHNELRKAFNVWAGYGNLTFIRSNKPTADIVISFGEGHHGDPYPFDGLGNILAHAFFPYYSNGGQVHFDNDENWTIRSTAENDDKTDFFSVASHELGHALGLGHSEVATSIMNPYYKEGKVLQLDYDDVMAMYQLYIRTQGDVNTEVKEITPKDYESSDESEENDDINPRVPIGQPTEENYPIENTTPPIIDNTVTTERSSTQSISGITFHGDYETVDVHKKHDTKYGLPFDRNNEPSNLCDGKYDSLANLRGELFVFKEKYVWRFEKRGKLAEGYPVEIKSLFPQMPESIERIDAAYERKDGTICFFMGNQYWLYRDELIEGPRLLTDFQITRELRSLDAVFIWSKNDRTYLFKNEKFWRFDESSNTLDEGYPKNMTRWRGIPNDLDAVIAWTDGITYFFKGALYWKFDNVQIQADKHYPLPAPQYWFGCPENFEKFKPEEILIMGLS